MLTPASDHSALAMTSSRLRAPFTITRPGSRCASGTALLWATVLVVVSICHFGIFPSTRSVANRTLNVDAPRFAVAPPVISYVCFALVSEYFTVRPLVLSVVKPAPAILNPVSTRNCICESSVSEAIQPLPDLSVPMVTSIASSKMPLPRPNFALPFTSQYPEYPVSVACLSIVRSVESKFTPPSLKEVVLRINVEVGVPAV